MRSSSRTSSAGSWRPPRGRATICSPTRSGGRKRTATACTDACRLATCVGTRARRCSPSRSRFLWRNPASESLAGVLKVVADVREIGAVIGGIRLGSTGDAVLLREDASIVFSQRLTDPNARFFAPDLLRERLQAMKQGQLTGPLHFGARTADGQARIVGMAPCLNQDQLPAARLDRRRLPGRERAVRSGPRAGPLAGAGPRADRAGRARVRVLVLGATRGPVGRRGPAPGGAPERARGR